LAAPTGGCTPAEALAFTLIEREKTIDLDAMLEIERRTVER
jgi:hypothetical protein